MLSISDTRLETRCREPINAAEHVLFAGSVPEERIALSVLSASRSERWSYGRLRAEVRRVAANLREEGLEPGQTLLLRLGHSPTFPIAFLGAIWAGIIPVPTSDGLTVSEISRIAEVLKPDATLFEDEIPLPEFRARTIPATHVITSNASTSIEPERGPADRLAYILCTSGTAKRPSLVRHAHRAIWARGFMREGWTGLESSDRLLHCGAFNWSYTLGTGLLDPWSIGATALVMSKDIDLSMVPLLAKRHDATILAAVPGVFRKLLRSNLPELPKLRHALSAGEKLPESLRAQWEEATGTSIHEAFGQTECSTFISGSPKRPAPSNTIGYPQPGRAVAITRDGQPIKQNEPGEISVSGDDPGLCLDQTAPASHWVGTGDLGQMDENGAVTYLGRKDDILTAGGYRITPVEIEHVFDEHPCVHVSAAIDYKLAEDTTVIALYYEADEAIEPPELEAYAAEHLAPYKIPRIFRRLETLPKSTNGKLLRRELRTATDAAS